MLYDNLKEYLRRMNFAPAGTAGQGSDFFRNQDAYNDIFVLLMDNTAGHIWTARNIRDINTQLLQHFSFSGRNPAVMFIIVTSDAERDKYLTALGVNVWLADSVNRKLRIYETQPDDFFGMKDEIREVILASRRPGAFNVDWGRVPYVTVVLIALNIIMFFISQAMGGAERTQVALRLGADYWPYVFYGHEYWRLFTSMFLHFGFMHLFSNMVYLAILGYRSERLIGWWKFLLIYLISGIGSSAASCVHYYLASENILSAGASGAIYGLMALTVCIMLYTYRISQRNRTLFSLALFLIFLAYTNFMSSGVDYMAHIAGFAFGLLVSFLLVHKKNLRQ